MLCAECESFFLSPECPLTAVPYVGAFRSRPWTIFQSSNGVLDIAPGRHCDFCLFLINCLPATSRVRLLALADEVGQHEPGEEPERATSHTLLFDDMFSIEDEDHISVTLGINLLGVQAGFFQIIGLASKSNCRNEEGDMC
jgi:hypothetical protein